MLIYSEQRLVPTDINMLTIAAKSAGYFYIHRALYDQAVIINDIYGDDIPQLIQAVSGKEETRDDVELFLEKAPSPIHIFGPFLLLVKQELTDFVDMVGAIHVMSGPINLRRMLKFPFEMRNNPTFSLSIREEYELAWDRFFKTTMPFGTEIVPVAPQQSFMPMNGTATVTVPTQEEELSSVGEDGVEYADPLEALLFGSGDDLFDMPDDFGEEEEDADKEEAVAPAPAPVVVPEPAPVPAPAPKPEKKIVTGLDALRNL